LKTIPEVTVTVEDLQPEFLLTAFDARRVAVDIETTGLDWKTDRIGTVQVHIPDYGTTIVRKITRRPRRLIELVTSARVQKVFHHAPFDLRFMAYQWDVRPLNVADTKLASQILEPHVDHKDHSLAPLVKRHFGVYLDKSVRFSDWLSPDLSRQQLQYAAQDVQYLLPLLDKLTEMAIDEGVADLIEASYAYLPVRIATDLRGCDDVFAY
jgi:ribonuclease D